MTTARAAGTDRVDLNLDTLEKSVDRPQSYSFFLDEHRYEMCDPEDVDWRDLMSITSPGAFFRTALSDDDYKRFIAVPRGKIPGWKLQQLLENWTKHFGLDLQQLMAGGGNIGALRR